MEQPVFDEWIILEDENSNRKELIVHRDIDGNEFCYHSPLEDGPIQCSLCEDDKVAVYMRHIDTWIQKT